MKKSNDIFSVNARVVDVQSGEVFAIGRGDVKKDKYITDVETAVQIAAEKKIADEKKAVEERKKRVEKSPWKVTEYRNDFDGETIYTFQCMNPDGTFLFLGFEKSDVPLNSRVRASMSAGTNLYYQWTWIQMKVDDGSILKFDELRVGSDYWTWDKHNGLLRDNRSNDFIYLYPTDVSNSKYLFNLFLENKIIVKRNTLENTIQPYQTEGLEEVMLAHGVTVADIEAAFANESF